MTRVLIKLFYFQCKRKISQLIAFLITTNDVFNDRQCLLKKALKLNHHLYEFTLHAFEGFDKFVHAFT